MTHHERRPRHPHQGPFCPTCSGGTEWTLHQSGEWGWFCSACRTWAAGPIARELAARVLEEATRHGDAEAAIEAVALLLEGALRDKGEP